MDYIWDVVSSDGDSLHCPTIGGNGAGRICGPGAPDERSGSGLADKYPGLSRFRRGDRCFPEAVHGVQCRRRICNPYGPRSRGRGRDYRNRVPRSRRDRQEQ